MNQILFHKLQTLIVEKIGLRVADRDRAGLDDALAGRQRTLGIDDVSVYIQLLERSDGSAQGEWGAFAALITNRESYFFRDVGQMDLLRRSILPELVEQARSQGRKLRIWSAGCSTGEEAYSLAIIARELAGENGPEVMVLGTDISPVSVETARRGLYGAWSFRMVDPALRDRYFHQQGNRWEIDRAIRGLVRFRLGNLTREVSASGAALEQFDLILCRNVFIYFDQESIGRTIAIFAGALRPGGYLLTGHAETSGVEMPGFEARRFPDSIIYQRSDGATARPGGPGKSSAAGAQATRSDAAGGRTPESPSARSTSTPPPVTRPRARGAGAPAGTGRPASTGAAPPSVGSGSGTGSGSGSAPIAGDRLARLLEHAPAMLERGEYEEVIEEGSRLIGEGHRGAPLLLAVAAAHASRGEHDRAVALCNDALRLDPESHAAHVLLAQIAEDRGDLDEAARLLERLLYLAPRSVTAHVLLAEIERRRGRDARAGRLRAIAVDLLEGVPDRSPIPDYPADAGELRAYLRGAGA